MSQASNSRARVAVVGGGLAGLTAACALSGRGVAVTLLEARHRLGGATYSFHRDGWPLLVDNGQHVVLGCYTRYRAFLGLLGTDDLVRFQPDLRIRTLRPGGPAGRLAAPRLPAPFHAAAALATYDLLAPGERLSALRAAAALGRLDPGDPAVDARTFGDWLREHRQGRRAREALWGLLCQAALNLDPDEASLALAAMVVRTAFLTDRGAARIGVPACPLHDLHVAPAARFLDAHGAVVRTGAPVRAVTPAPGGYAVCTDGGESDFDAVVLAAPAAETAALLPDAARTDREALVRLGSSPIVNVHLRLDRPVLHDPFAAVVGSCVSFVFDRTPEGGLPDGGQYLSMPLSAAEDWVDLPTAEIRRRVLPALLGVLPALATARELGFFVTRERRATFRQVPGSAALRPGARSGGLPGLVLAGAWTATGWPDTIEGAVRSGETAAGAVLDDLASARHPSSDRRADRPEEAATAVAAGPGRRPVVPPPRAAAPMTADRAVLPPAKEIR